MHGWHLKDAYFSIPIHEAHQKYLKFMWKSPLKFTAMPNGYGPAMLKFTKIMKPPFAWLRTRGHQSVVWKIVTFTFEAFGQEPMLCPVLTIEEYLKRRNTLTNTKVTSLFVTCAKPHHTPSQDTIARWVKGVMKDAGVDTNVFHPHSCRSASTSK